MTDIRQSAEWKNYMEDLGWKMERIGVGFAFVRRLPVGSLIKIPRVAGKINFKEIDEIAKKTKAFFVKLEPDSLNGEEKVEKEILENGFRADRWSLHPTKTIVIDLTKPEVELMASLEKDTRYSVRASEKKGVVVRESNDLETFWKLYSETSKRGKFWVSRVDLEKIWANFSPKKATFLTAFSEKTPLASCLLLFNGETAYYFHAGSASFKREFFASYLLVWKAMLSSKEKGFKNFDLMGITDERFPATKSWRGFSHFKKGFGGKEVIYIGSYIKFYNPLVRLLFSFDRFF